MGMASSQARLLMITSRMHDIEYQAASIQNAKLQLATQQDEAYEKYQQALDATTLTMQTINGTSGEHSTIPANFSNVFGLNAANPASGATNNSGYILVDSRGRVVVEDEVEEGYNNFINNSHFNNAQNFAFYMLSGGQFMENNTSDPLQSVINSVFGNKILAEGSDGTLHELINEIYEAAGITHQVTPTTLTALLQFLNAHGTGDYSNELNQFITYFYQNFSTEIFNDQSIADDYDKADFNYYVRIFNAIQQHGGCISISDFNGPNGDAATNSEWLTAMIQSGQLSIEMAQIDGQGNFNLNGVSVSSDTNLSYTPTTSIDKAALAKAEAEYEHTLKVIDRKDKKFDLSLKKLETERNALDKQRESVEKVIEDNVDRTFKIFS